MRRTYLRAEHYTYVDNNHLSHDVTVNSDFTSIVKVEYYGLEVEMRGAESRPNEVLGLINPHSRWKEEEI